MHNQHKVDNSESDLLYSLSHPPFDISPTSASTELDSIFPRHSSLPHSTGRSISSDSIIQEFVQRGHPSLDLYRSNHIAGPLQRSEQSTTRLSASPPSAPRTQKLPTPRRFSRSHTYSDDEEDPLDKPLPENATEQEKIDWRRRQNTLAARKSRKRKQDQMQQLQDDVQRLSKEKDVWKERALMMKQLLISHGLPSPNFGRCT